MAATIKSVAEAAHVSTATVSHVFNETRYVSEETKQKVLEAAKALGYIPNASARSLRNNKTKRIGLLVPAISSFFTVDIQDAIEQVLTKNGYQLIIGSTHENIEREKEQVAMMSYQQIDGLLLFPAPGNHQYLDELPRSYPIVTVDRIAEGVQRDLISAENYKSAYSLVSEMLDKGYTKIGLINGTEGISALQERVEGYRKAFTDRGLAFDSSLIKNGNSSIEKGYEATEQLLAEPGLQAIISLTPSMTIGCFQCLLKHNVKIPEEIALAGFGDSAWTEITNPPLTAVQHPMFEMGKCAAKLLLQRLEEGEISDYKEIRFPMELIHRKSF